MSPPTAVAPHIGTTDSQGRTADLPVGKVFLLKGTLCPSLSLTQLPLGLCGRMGKVNQWSDKTVPGPPQSNHN